jgi:hypothetical protein
VLTADDVDKNIRVFVTATNDLGASTAWSLPTPLVGKTTIGTSAGEHFEGSRGGDYFSGLGGSIRSKATAGRTLSWAETTRTSSTRGAEPSGFAEVGAATRS